MTISRCLALFALLLTFAASADAQTSETRRVVLTDGTVLVGTIDNESADPIVLRSASGVEQRIRRANIAQILPLVDGRFIRTDPTRTRTILSPTGRTLGRGTKRLATALYIIPNGSVGVTDRVDLSGTAFVSFGSGGGGVVPALGAKIGIVDSETFAVAVGTTIVFPLTGDSDVDGSFIATPYVALTAGSEIRSATVGLTGVIGGDITSGDVEAGNGALLQFGGHSQLSNSIALVGELVVPIVEGASGVAFLPGVRFFGDKFSVDVYGALGSADGEFGGFAPFANFAYTF